jgi:hypothetical protein
MPSSCCFPGPRQRFPRSQEDHSERRDQPKLTFCKCAKSQSWKCPARTAPQTCPARGKGTQNQGILAVHKLDGYRQEAESENPASRSSRGRSPDPDRRAASLASTVAVLCCCTRCPGFRIMSLTNGAMGIRTPDLLHAIQRQPGHPRVSAQVTVLPRPLQSTRVQACCSTSLLYRSAPARHPPPAIDQSERPRQYGAGVHGNQATSAGPLQR